MKKKLLIVEHALQPLESAKKSTSGEYVMEGTFAYLGEANRNGRYYVEEDYLPQLETLTNRIEAKGNLLGELDHPEGYDVSMKNASHVIDSLSYDENNRQITGKIRLLNTDAGKNAQAMVDAGVPLSISSRAAGVVESDGRVKFKKLVTFDLVADPGFENAQLNRVNESYGFELDDRIGIYEVDEDGKIINEWNTDDAETQNNDNDVIKEDTEDTKSTSLKVQDFSRYTENTKKAFDSLRERIEGVEDFKKNLAESTNEAHVIKWLDNISKAVNGLNEKVNSNTNNIDKIVTYNDDVLLENFKNLRNYSEYANSNAVDAINFADKIIKEDLTNIISYIENAVLDPIAERFQLQDKINELHIDDDGLTIQEKLQTIKGILENVSISESGNEVRPDGSTDMDSYEDDLDGLDYKDNIMNAEDEYFEELKEGFEVFMESIDKMRIGSNGQGSFRDFLSPANDAILENLDTSVVTFISEKFEDSDYFSTADGDRIFNNAILEHNALNWQIHLSDEHKAIWESLSDTKREQIANEADGYKLVNEEAVNNFMNGRDLIEAPIEVSTSDTIVKINESADTDHTTIDEAISSAFDDHFR